MDWKRLGQRRGTRRWFLGVSGATLGAAGLAATGCGGSPAKPTPSPSPTSATAPPVRTPITGPRPTPTRDPNDRHGGFVRYTGFIRSINGQFDPHKTSAPPLHAQQAMVFSRLLTYEDQAAGVIGPDLAVGLPEQPDPQTYVFHLNAAARWHDIAPLSGRAVTADDVKFSIERQAAGDLSFARRAQWSMVESVEATDPETVVVGTSAPYAELLDLVAGVGSFVLAPEVAGPGMVMSPQTQIGSGPFLWVEWNEGDFASVSANHAWHGGNQRPFLDGVTVIHRTDTATIEGDLRTRALDAAIVGRPQADRLKQSIPELVEATAGLALFFSMRFVTSEPPFNDPRLRTAISIALDRRAMVEHFFAGSGFINPWVSAPITRWALPEAELFTYAGYRPGTGGRETDIQEARGLLEAYLSENTIDDGLRLLVTSDAEEVLGMGSLMSRQLQENLGLAVTVTPVPIGELIQRLLEGEAPWAAGPDTGWLGLDDWTYQYFHSAGTNNSFPLRDPDMDALIEQQRAEMNPDARRELGYAIQRRLLELNVAANFVSEKIVTLRWPYVQNFPLDAADGYQHRFADCWIDHTDPTYTGS